MSWTSHWPGYHTECRCSGVLPEGPACPVYRTHSTIYCPQIMRRYGADSRPERAVRAKCQAICATQRAGRVRFCRAGLNPWLILASEPLACLGQLASSLLRPRSRRSQCRPRPAPRIARRAGARTRAPGARAQAAGAHRWFLFPGRPGDQEQAVIAPRHQPSPLAASPGAPGRGQLPRPPGRSSCPTVTKCGRCSRRVVRLDRLAREPQGGPRSGWCRLPGHQRLTARSRSARTSSS